MQPSNAPQQRPTSIEPTPMKFRTWTFNSGLPPVDANGSSMMLIFDKTDFEYGRNCPAVIVAGSIDTSEPQVQNHPDRMAINYQAGVEPALIALPPGETIPSPSPTGVVVIGPVIGERHIRAVAIEYVPVSVLPQLMAALSKMRKAERVGDIENPSILHHFTKEEANQSTTGLVPQRSAVSYNPPEQYQSKPAAQGGYQSKPAAPPAYIQPEPQPSVALPPAAAEPVDDFDNYFGF
eukprot:GHVH01006550.1.p1 GENE.GHVH01006550.1~~GHVH01006550.1.p1  ORF type:complete len:249 (+),score=35.92 GHVH01006550.1:40-747(+)